MKKKNNLRTLSSQLLCHFHKQNFSNEFLTGVYEHGEIHNIFGI